MKPNNSKNKVFRKLYIVKKLLLTKCMKYKLSTSCFQSSILKNITTVDVVH